jgi:thiamine kinase-like enzyme
LLAHHRRIAAGDIPERVTHNDTKLNNVLLDDVTAEGVCVIDLDTTMPGSALYDFGDMVRTATPTTREDDPDLANIGIRLDRFEALVKGYLSPPPRSSTAERPTSPSPENCSPWNAASVF